MSHVEMVPSSDCVRNTVNENLLRKLKNQNYVQGYIKNDRQHLITV